MAWIDNQKAYDRFLQNWMIDCLKMYKTSDEFIKFLKKIENSSVELTAGGKSLAEVKIRRGIFQGDALSPLLFVKVMMPRHLILRKYTGGYKLSQSKEIINHLMYVDDIKQLAKNEKELETSIQVVRIYSQEIGMEFGIEKCALPIMKSGK